MDHMGIGVLAISAGLSLSALFALLILRGYFSGVCYGRRYAPATLRSRKSWMSGKTSSALSSRTK
jgi:hypothetical protein